MQNNAITSVPDDAFSMLAPNFKKSVYGAIYMNNNQITSIADHAFNGISDKIYKIFLSNNNLTSVPVALVSLTNLDSLQIDGNPISTLDSATMSSIGKTLRQIWIDMDKLAVWPTELGLLSHIFEVKMSAILFNKIPDDAFQNWKHLGSLTILNSKLDTLPVAMCSINTSYSVYFNDNSNIKKDADIFPGCQNNSSQTDTLTSATLKNNDLTSTSNILSTFVRLEYMTVSGNPHMYFIKEEHVTANHSLRRIALDHNHFDRIPEALQKLNKLYDLDLSYNFISSIQRHDLDGFGNLHVIQLQNNPLIYVSSDAFLSSGQLTTIFMQKTNLTQIPQGVVTLQNLTQINLAGNPIVCACDDMSNLKTWANRVYWFTRCNGTCLYLNGLCDGSQRNIADYVKNTLTKCP